MLKIKLQILELDINKKQNRQMMHELWTWFVDRKFVGFMSTELRENDTLEVWREDN